MHEESDENLQPTSPEQQGIVNEAFKAQFLQVFGGQSPYRPTESQVDKILAIQEKGMDYTHKERTMFQPKHVLDFVGAVCILIFLIVILLIIVFKAPNYTGEAISGLLGLIGGGGAGYAFGIKSKKPDSE